MRFALVFSLALLAQPVAALTADEESFVEANLIATLYHELGHALIDTMGLPVFGQEEDAADVLSVLLLDALFDEETAAGLVLDTAFGFYESAQRDEVAFWDTHGPDEQRFFNTVCLFYGANPDEREDIVLDLGLPEERAETCPEEFDLANESWGPVLDELAENAPGRTVTTVSNDSASAQFAHSVIAPEVAALNQDFGLPEEIAVEVGSCGEPNAFYHPGTHVITICSEFVDFLADLMPE